MTEETHVHICRGTNPLYRGMVRVEGHRKWEPAGKWRKSERGAFSDMTKKFFGNRRYKRGALWYITDYYDPISLMEIHR